MSKCFCHFNGYEVKDAKARRDLEDLKINNKNYLSLVSAIGYRPNSNISILQGGCYCGNNIVACYFKNSTTLQLINLTTGEVIKEHSYPILEHGNGMCKIGDYLYVCGTGNTSTNNVYKIDYETLETIELVNVYGDGKIQTGENISCIAYSPITEKVYITIAPVFPNLKCYVFDKTLETLERVHIIENDANYGGFITNIGYWNNFIMVNYNYGKTQLFNESDFSLYKEIEIDLNVGSRYATEIEFIDSYENGDIIVGVMGFVGTGYGSGNIFFAKTNFSKSVRTYPVITGKQYTNGKEPKLNVVYVDNTIPLDPLRDGSLEKPFYSLYEATNSLMVDGFDCVDIYLKGDFSNEGLYMVNARNVRVYPRGEGLINVREILLLDTNQVYFKNIKPLNTFNIKESKATLYYTDSSVKDITVDIANTGELFIECLENTINIKGVNNGKVELTKFNRISGFVGKLLQTGGYSEICNSRNIANCKERARLDGNNHTATNTLTFFTPLMVCDVDLQVGGDYYKLPVTGRAISYSIKLKDDTLLNVQITQDNETYNFQTYKYVLSHETATIYDCFVNF